MTDELFAYEGIENLPKNLQRMVEKSGAVTVGKVLMDACIADCGNVVFKTDASGIRFPVVVRSNEKWYALNKVPQGAEATDLEEYAEIVMHARRGKCLNSSVCSAVLIVSDMLVSPLVAVNYAAMISADGATDVVLEAVRERRRIIQSSKYVVVRMWRDCNCGTHSV